MKTHSFKLSAIASVAILAACGGGTSDPAPAEPAAAAPVAVTPAPTPVLVEAPAPTPIVAPSTETAQTAATAFLAKYDALLATAIPTPGSSALALNDGCYLQNGSSKAFVVADFDSDPVALASRRFVVGSVRSNVRVLAERASTNADGTSRREIDVKYDVAYKDGTKFTALDDATPNETIISGSSTGSKEADGSACATAESKSDWRFYGNRKVINANVGAYNERTARTSLATGQAVTPSVVYSKYIRFNVTDPANVAKYATISGPGIVSGSPAAPITLKMVSVRLLRDAPEFAGKNGNFVDWKDTDTWRICRTTTGGLAAAETADCVANGATTNNWGSFGATAPATIDTSFDALGVVAGGEYTVKVYNDDGWKTVNGQVSSTPVATYTIKLANLPFKAATIGGAPGVAPDLFPRLSASSTSFFDIAAAIRGRTAVSTDLTWTPEGTMPDGRPLGWGSLYSFKQGRVNAGQLLFNPASRQFDPTYPAANVAGAALAVPAAVAKLGAPTYAEITFSMNNRNGNVVQSIYSFQ